LSGIHGKKKKKSKHEGKKEKQIQSAKEGWQHETLVKR
jgi:hypothetical protein